MPSTYSGSLRLELIADGEQAGSWGQTTNRNLGTLLEQSIAGVVAITHDNNTDYNLTVQNGQSDQSRCMVLNVSGTLTANRNVVAPSVSKVYIVRNNTTGGFAITIKTAAGAGVLVPNGQTVWVWCDGTDFRSAMTSAAGFTVASGVLSVPLGAVGAPSLSFAGDADTGIWSPGAGQVAFANNGVQSLSVSANRNVTIAAPVSGTTLTASTVAGGITLDLVARPDGYSGIRMRNNANSASNFRLESFEGVIHAITGSGATTPLHVRTNDIDRIIVAAAGNVTINAPASGGTLTVNNIANQAAIFTTDGTTQSVWQSFGASGLSIGAFSNHQLQLLTNNTARVTVAAAGNVTINAPASGTTLTAFWSGTQDGVQLGGFATNVTSRLFLGSAADSAAAGVQYERSSGAIRIGHISGGLTTAMTDRMVFSAAGNVTINAPASGRPLQVNNINGQLNVALIGRPSDGAAGIAFRNNADSSENGAIIGLNTGDLTLWSNAVLRMQLNAAGNVTINAPSSGTALTVNGVASGNPLVVNVAASTNFGIDVLGGASAAVRIRIASNSVVAGTSSFDIGQGWASATDGIGWILSRAADMVLATNATERLRLSHSTGNATFAGYISAAGYITAVPSASHAGTLTTSHRGQCVQATAGVTVPASTFAAGDAVSIYNNTAGNITITQGASLTLRQVGTANTGNRTLAQRGYCTIWFISATEAVISGGGLS